MSSGDDPVFPVTGSAKRCHRSDEGRGPAGLLHASDQGSQEAQDPLDGQASGFGGSG